MIVWNRRGDAALEFDPREREWTYRVFKSPIVLMKLYRQARFPSSRFLEHSSSKSMMIVTRRARHDVVVGCSSMDAQLQ